MSTVSGLQANERKYRFFYCHGWGSRFNPSGDKIQELSRLGTVSGISVDYSETPRRVFEAFSTAVSGEGRVTIVGTSLGGFYAAWLAAELGLKFVAINPSVYPKRTLRRFLGRTTDYYGRETHLSEAILEEYSKLEFRRDGVGTVVLDDGDEVLDAKETLSFIGNSIPTVVFPGGSHRFDHMRALVEEYESIFTQRC